MWRVSKDGVMPDYPVPIRRMWKSLPSDLTKVDAVYENHNGHAVIFIGNKFWRFAGNRLMNIGMLSDFGISEDIEKISGIFIWGKTNETFIFSDDVYWK